MVVLMLSVRIRVALCVDRAALICKVKCSCFFFGGGGGGGCGRIVRVIGLLQIMREPKYLMFGLVVF